MSNQLIVQGGQPLNGKVRISGSKNAVLPLLAASLLVAKGETVFSNVPDISDVHTMLNLLAYLGAKTSYISGTVKINAENVKFKTLPHTHVSKIRASILLLAPLYARFGKVEMDFPGGCVIGKRSASAHVNVLEKFGAKNQSTTQTLNFSGKSTAAEFTLPEISVTATENALMLAAATNGKTIIRLAAAEPHVQDLCKFLVAAGAKIEGIGTHTLTVRGAAKLKAVKHTVCGDYLELGTLAIAAALTRGKVEILGGNPHDLDIFWEKFEEIGVPFAIRGQSVYVEGAESYTALEKLDTGVFPKFPTDLQAPFGVLLTQCEGRSRIFETLFEGRLAYLYELEKMGAHVEIINSHQATVFGQTNLRGAEVTSYDLRAGAAMLLAGLVAKGQTTVHDVQYLDRGYEKLDQKLKALGAQIERKE